MATLIKIDRNGTKYFSGDVPCERCGGAGGADKWAFTGWTCFKCGGTGKQTGTWKEYTPEYEAKLKARREAKMAKLNAEFEAEQARLQAEREKAEAEAEAQRQAEETRIKAEKAISKYVGEIGDKIEMKVTFEHSAYWEQTPFCGFGTETMYAHTFKDAEGNKLVWKTTKWIGNTTTDEKGNCDYAFFEEGQELFLKGTIKEHSEYKEEKQTILTRCKVSSK